MTVCALFGAVREGAGNQTITRFARAIPIQVVAGE
jgi:hypothetical protein